MNKLFIKLSFILSISVFLVACGGGGGGSGASETPDGLSYTGLSSLASISSTSIASNYVEAYKQLNISDLGNPFPASSSSAMVKTPAATESGTITGNCGGEASYIGSEDNGYIELTFDADDLCSDGTILDGVMTFSGYENNYTIGFSPIRFIIESSNIDYSLSGKFDFTISGNDISLLTQTAIFKNNNNNVSIKVEQWQEVVNTSVSPEQLEVSGRFYHPEYGYVSFTTLEPMEMDGFNASSGEIKLSGDNSVAYITFYPSSYYVELDLNNNGSIDLTETVTP